MSVMAPTREDITLLLKKIDYGSSDAMEHLMRVVYADLERMAASQLRRQFGDRVGQLTLEPAGLVNETFLQLIRQRRGFDNRGQFFAIATKMMLRVLIDYRRSRMAAKRGGGHAAGAVHFTIAIEPGVENASHSVAVDIQALSEALERLEFHDARKAEIVKMRTVWGMSISQIADALEISGSAVDRDWRFARAWMAEELGLTRP